MKIGGKPFKQTAVGKTLNGIFKPKKKAVRVTRTKPTNSKPVSRKETRGGSIDEFGRHASERKALNAKVAAPAIANKIEHQNWNGIAGEYAKLALLAEAASNPEGLNVSELAALESLGIDPEDLVAVNLEEYANTSLEGYFPDGAKFDVSPNADGTFTVSCTNCSDHTNPKTGQTYTEAEIDAINVAAADELSLVKAEHETANGTLDTLYDDAEDTLLARTKEEVTEENGYTWLDGVADHLDIERPQDITNYKSPEPTEENAEFARDNEAGPAEL